MSDAPHVLAVAGVRLDDGSVRRYSFALTGRPLRVAAAGRWGVAGPGRRDGRRPDDPGLRSDDGSRANAHRPPRSSAGRRARWLAGVGALGERALGADQSNTSVVLGEPSCSRRSGGSSPGSTRSWSWAPT